MLHPRRCCLQRLCAAYINLQRSFFCSARVEYFSNEFYILTPTFKWTHQQRQAYGNEIKSEKEGLGEAKGHTQTHTHVHTQTNFTHYLTSSICILYCPLFTINVWASLYTNPNFWVLSTHSYTPKILPSSAFVLMAQNLQATNKKNKNPEISWQTKHAGRQNKTT